MRTLFMQCARLRVWRSLAGLSLTAELLRAAPSSAQPWTDATLPSGQRAKLLAASMTSAEKVAMVHGTSGSPYVGHVPGIARLGIPDLNLEDGPAGVADGMTGVTVFPAPITIAASWDAPLAQRFGAAIAAEQALKGANVVLGPMMNMDRVPQAGRNFEGFGEDPWVSGAMAAAVVRGIQGQGLVATAKHYVDNEQETARKSVSSVVDERTQREVYLPPFASCVAAGVGAVMCSYNRVDGTYACEDGDTLNGWLKGDLGFPGWVMSDWGATHGVGSAVQGLDMEMPTASYFGAQLASAVQTGSVPPSRVDDMVDRILTSMFAAGLFDRAPTGSPSAPATSDADVAFARDAAAQGTVLLKNDGALLPFDPAKIRSIAVIGAAADSAPVFQGLGSSMVSGSRVVTPRQGIAARAGTSIPVAYAAGATAPFDDATSLAARSDVAVVVVGVTSGEGSDRPSLSLPSPDDALVAAVAQANPKTVVVVYAPAQVLLPWAAAVPGILFGGLPGEEEGDALADVLFGDVNPSAKSTITFAQSAADFPANTTAQFPGVGGSSTYSEGFLVGYRAFDANGTVPLFPFGHGLSYTSYAYANLAIAPGAVTAGEGTTISFDVTNSGAVAGDEIVQLYLGLPSETSEPPWQLRGFQKVSLAPQATVHVTFPLDASAYSFWSAGRHGSTAFPGQVGVRVGASSRDVRLSGAFEVQGGPLSGTVHQAESAVLCCGASVASADAGSVGYTGSSFVTGLGRVGASATVDVFAPAAGPCALTTRYSVATAPGTLSLYVNGVRLRQVTFPPLANLSTWDFETETADLAAGDNSVTFQRDATDTGGVILDALIDCFDGADAGVFAVDAGDGASTVSTASAACPVACPAAPAPPAAAGGCGCREVPSGGETPATALALGVLLAVRRWRGLRARDRRP
jgi:beta-glucosidase